MRFILIIALTLVSAEQATATSTNGLTLLRKILPTKLTGTTIAEKASRFVVGAGFVGLTFCGAISLNGCDRGEQILIDVVDVEDIYNQGGRDSQYITFIINGVSYEGYWEETHDDQLLVELDNGDTRIVLLEQIDGFLVPNHQDIGALVYLRGELNGEEIYRRGEVIDVYDNGYYSIEVTYEEYANDGERITLFRPYTVLVHQALLLADGGFTFED